MCGDVLLKDIVGDLVRLASTKGIRPQDIRSADVDEAAFEAIGRRVGLSDSSVSQALSAVNFVSSRNSEGGIGPQQVASLLTIAETSGQGARLRIEKERLRVQSSQHLLEEAVKQLIAE